MSSSANHPCNRSYRGIYFKAFLLFGLAVILFPTAFGKAKKGPRRLKLTPIILSPADAERETRKLSFEVRAIPVPYRNDLRKTAFFLRFKNTGKEPIPFGIKNLRMLTEKGKPLPVLNREESLAEIEKESQRQQAQIKNQGDRTIRDYEGHGSYSRQVLDNYEKSVASSSLAYDLSGSKSRRSIANKDQILQAVDARVDGIQKQEAIARKRVEENYLRDAEVNPGETLQGLFDVKLPKKLPPSLSLRVEVEGEQYRFDYNLNLGKTE